MRGKTTSGGFTYLALLFFVVAAGALSSATGIIWSTQSQRSKEEQLTYVGEQYRRAIKSYYEQSPGAVKRYPRELGDLLRDERQVGIVRHLRRLYRDPITLRSDWGIVRAADGGIMGVFSKSASSPIRASNLSSRVPADVVGRTYADWKFVYVPPAPSKP